MQVQQLLGHLLMLLVLAEQWQLRVRRLLLLA